MEYNPNKYPIYERYKLFRAKAMAHQFEGDIEEFEAQIFEKFVKGQNETTTTKTS